MVSRLNMACGLFMDKAQNKVLCIKFKYANLSHTGYVLSILGCINSY